MALNKTFTCNTIVDENNIPIDCNYQGLHVRSGIWNSVRTSSFNQYNINLGDADWLTQSGEALIGDKVILVFWQSGTDRTGIKTRLSAVEFTITSANTYINDIQLIPKTAPTCSWTFDSSTKAINNLIGTIESPYDYYSWTFNNIIHYHYRTLYSTLIFDSIDVLTSTFDWNDNLGFVTTKTKTYTQIGDYNVSQRVTNAYNLSSICTNPLRIFYNKPIPGLSFIYTSPLHTTENITVNANIIDTDSRITNINHKLLVRDRNNYNLIQDILINSNNLINYSYIRTIELLQRHFFTQEIYWNDGFTNNLFSYSSEVPIENWCPVVSISKQDKNDLRKLFIHSSSDKDGTIVNYNWKIYFIAPFSTGSYALVHEYNTTLPDNWEVQFTVGGSYKVELSVTDDFGCTISDNIIFDIIAPCPTSITSNINNIKFIFPKQMVN